MRPASLAPPSLSAAPRAAREARARARRSIVVYGLVVVFKFELGAEFWYLWLPNFVVGGILFLTVFLRSARLHPQSTRRDCALVDLEPAADRRRCAD